MMKLRVLGAVVAVHLIFGCSLFKKRQDAPYPWESLERTTENGYAFSWIEKGTTTKEGLWKTSRSEIDKALSDAVQAGAKRLAATYEGPTEKEWISIAKSHRWVGVDDVNFVASDGFQLAAGEHVPASPSHWIEAAYYTRMPSAFGVVKWMPGDPEPWPEGTPPWLIKENPQQKGEWRWGELKVPYPAISNGHELGHHVWGARFEHGWRPPLRQNVTMKAGELDAQARTCTMIGF